MYYIAIHTARGARSVGALGLSLLAVPNSHYIYVNVNVDVARACLAFNFFFYNQSLIYL